MSNDLPGHSIHLAFRAAPLKGSEAALRTPQRG